LRTFVPRNLPKQQQDKIGMAYDLAFARILEAESLPSTAARWCKVSAFPELSTADFVAAIFQDPPTFLMEIL
jgi:hypothetical protein